MICILFPHDKSLEGDIVCLGIYRSLEELTKLASDPTSMIVEHSVSMLSRGGSSKLLSSRRVEDGARVERCRKGLVYECLMREGRRRGRAEALAAQLRATTKHQL